VTDAAAFRSAFPVLERTAYLNAGTCGPVPAAAARAAVERIEAETVDGRAGEGHWEAMKEMAARLRGRCAGVLGCGPEAVALTGSTTDGVNAVLSALDLCRGDEILTSDEEHPGLLAPLAAARRRLGVEIRVVPLARIVEEVRPGTRLVACSHVSWVNGYVVDAAALGRDGAEVLLDGAQGLGAVPVDVGALGCDYYAASGQKWLCGPEGLGCLYVKPERLEALTPPWPGYSTLAAPERALDFELKAGAERLDVRFPTATASAWALESIDVLSRAGWEWVHERGRSLAGRLVEALTARGLWVAPRGRSTLVSWSAPDPESEVARLRSEGFVVRHLPGRGLVRASVGAWNSEDELDRLAEMAEIVR
jgi:L-cysteine/cystine lyase